MIVFVTNICTHYTSGLFEKLSSQHQIDFLFYADENEWYWQNQNGKFTGNFKYRYLPGIRIGRTKISFSLAWELIKKPYNIYIKCINGKFALPVTFLIAKLKRKPFILWTGIWMRMETPFHKLAFPLTKWIYKHSDAIVVYGEHVKRYLITEGITSEKIFVANHAINNDFYGRKVSEEEKKELKESLGIAQNEKIILYLGRLEQNKGVDHLILAFSKLLGRSDVTLLVAGSGSQQENLKKISNDLGISERVKFCGYVPISETVKYYSIASIFVIPSITTSYFKEPWGLVVNEAMNQAVPVIASDSVGAGAGELIENGVNGMIFPETDIEALCNSLEYLLGNDERRIQMGKNAKMKIKEWNYLKMVDGFNKAIEFVQGQNK
jgi:Glycosyltransferase